MKDLKITKGEWTYSKYEPYDYGVYSEEGDGRDIALVRSKKDEEESVANAKLIAAAPELLKALLLFNEDSPAVWTYTPAKAHKYLDVKIKASALRAIKDAIQKATE